MMIIFATIGCILLWQIAAAAARGFRSHDHADHEQAEHQREYRRRHEARRLRDPDAAEEYDR